MAVYDITKKIMKSNTLQIVWQLRVPPSAPLRSRKLYRKRQNS